jgi:NitT/TauT family transport system ATP-binding protein
MQQRVALVRAFALGAPILLMDEPFAALDEITRADMRHLLVTLCEQLHTTVVFVTHSLPEAVFLSDRVAVLSQRPGHIVDVVAVDLVRPRRPEVEDDPAFFALETRLRHLLHEGSQR